MKVLFAMLMLLINFIKSTFLSGIDTARIILFRRQETQDGLTELSYGALNENTASLLGAMITLTPGTTLVDIDVESGVLLLHLLDIDSRHETLELIRRDYYKHLKKLNEVMP